MKTSPVVPLYCKIIPSLVLDGIAFNIKEVLAGPVIVLCPPPDLNDKSPSILTAFVLLLVQSPNFAPNSSSNIATVLGVPAVLTLIVTPDVPAESYLLSI